MKYLKLSLIVLFFALFSGCAALAITGGGLGVGYTFSNIAYKTVNYPIDKVDKAILEASRKMDFKIIDNSETDEGRTIKAATGKLDIYIDLEKVTSTTTRITVNAKDGIIFKDKATATELINQTEKILGS